MKSSNTDFFTVIVYGHKGIFPRIFLFVFQIEFVKQRFWGGNTIGPPVDPGQRSCGGPVLKPLEAQRT